MDLQDQIRADQARSASERKQRLARAGELVRSEFAKVLGKQGSEHDHAPKGDPPRRQSGRLLSSIKVRVDGDAVVIYVDQSTCPYAEFVERLHPFFVVTIDKLLPQVRSIIFGAS